MVITIISVTLALIVTATVVIVRRTKADERAVRRELDNLTALVNESKTPNKLAAYKEAVQLCRARAVGSQRKEIDELISNINQRQMEWMSIELDEALDDIINSLKPTNEAPVTLAPFMRAAETNPNLEKHKGRRNWHHKKPTHHKK